MFTAHDATLLHPVTTATIDAARPRPGATAPNHTQQILGAAVGRPQRDLLLPPTSPPASSPPQPRGDPLLVLPYTPAGLLW